MTPDQSLINEPLSQIWVDENHPKWGRREIPIGPKMHAKFLGPLMEQINRCIIRGEEKQWSNPRLVVVESTRPVPVDPFTREDRSNPLVAGHRYAGAH